MNFILFAMLFAQTGEADVKAAREPIEIYLRGLAMQDPQVLRSAFHPGAHIQGMRGGQFTDWTVDEYVKNFKGTPAADEAKRVRRIDMVEVTGTAGIAKATSDYPQVKFTDYFVIMKVDGVWKIMNKVFQADVK